MSAGDRLPVVLTREVYHVGTMNPADKGLGIESFEGPCLSVSHCPNGWVSIAKLGGLPVWTLLSAKGVFLDVLAVSRNPVLRARIASWGRERGYVSQQVRWKTWFTGESGDWRYMLCLTEEDAVNEAESNEVDAGPNGGPPVEPVTVLIGSPELCRYLGHRHLNDVDAFDYLALMWGDLTQPTLDGAWWREVYDPDGLSAPRGGIFPSRLERWRHTKARLSSLEDDAIEEGLVEAEMPVESVAKPVLSEA